jgi:hypothetical protein
MQHQTKSIVNAIRDAVAAALMVSVLGYASYLMLEPGLIIGQSATDQFVVEQIIGSEISFLTTANDVSLAAIGGVTGGASQGFTSVRVYTNDTAGFTMTITASNSPAMQGISQGGSIANYTPAAANVPDYTYATNTTGQSAEFGYTVSASTTSHLAQKFLDNGSNTCNTGANDTNGTSTCWYNLTTSATSTIVTTGPSAISGASSTLAFRVHVPANPSPALPEDTYRATSTLTATTN